MSSDPCEKSLDLQQQFGLIQGPARDPMTARNIALASLEPHFCMNLCSNSVQGTEESKGVWYPGLHWVAQIYRTNLSEDQPGILGYTELEEEFRDLKSALDGLASRLKKLTPQAAVWIRYPKVEGSPLNDRIQVLSDRSDICHEIDLQTQGQKGPLVNRLEAFSELMRLLLEQAEKEKGEAPPGKQYVANSNESPAFRLFLHCGKELLGRGYDLKHTRPIAVAIHAWATGKSPSELVSWERRAEREAKIALTRTLSVP